MFYYQDPNKIKEKAASLAVYYIIMGIVALLGSTIQFGGVAEVGERISLRLRSDMFEGLMRREITFYDYDENAIGALTTRLADDSRIGKWKNQFYKDDIVFIHFPDTLFIYCY